MVNAEVAIFARLPVLGKVKTRLASGVGPERALRFYKACAEHVFRECSKCESTRATVYFSVDNDLPGAKAWLAAADLALPCAPQVKDQDLGVRMHAALEALLAQQCTSKAIVLGTDIPDISASILQQAVSALDSHELVIGPAVDGGYYLLGTTVAIKELFQGIAWSTESVFQQTMQKAKELQLQAYTLPMLQDIDTMQDLEQWHRASLLRNANHPIMPVVTDILQ
ncbi:hypothetical protein ABBQ38_009460 [Trebouxia sp. C0009 RCD-2024]